MPARKAAWGNGHGGYGANGRRGGIPARRDMIMIWVKSDVSM